MDQSLPPASSFRPFCFGALGLLVLVGGVFHAVPGFDFVRWDDDINVTQNPLLTAPWSWSLVGQLFDGDQALRFKPLHWLCFRGLHAVVGLEPAGWHVFGLTLHAVAAVLFYAVLRRVFRLTAWGAGDPAGSEWAALAGAGLWAVHPLRAEAVAWVTASPYGLTAVMLLASFLFYLKAAEVSARSGWWLVLAWVFAVLAYASYPVGLTYGLWLMAVDRWLLPARAPRADGAGTRGRVDWAWWGKHAAFLAPAGLALGVTVWSRFTAPGVFTVAPDVEAVGLLPRVAMALASLIYFVRVLVWPVDLTPNLSPLRGDAMTWVAVSALLAAVGLGLIWRVRDRWPAWALVAFGFAGLALPCLGWTERPTWPVDRYSYVVHLVLVGGIVGGLWRWTNGRRERRLALGAGVMVIMVLWSIAAWRQAAIWHDSRTLFTHMERHPNFAENPRQQGHIYVVWGRFEATVGRRERAAELFNAAQGAYLEAIKGAVAEANYGEALSLSTHLEHFFTLTPVMRRERGAWLLRLGRKAEALRELRAAASDLPGDARVAELLAAAEGRP